MAPKSNKASSSSKAKSRAAAAEAPPSPGARREEPDDEDDLEQMTPLDAEPDEPERTTTKKGGKKSAKKKKAREADDEDGEQAADEETVTAKKVTGEKRAKAAAPQEEEEGGEEEGGGDEEEEEDHSKIKRDRRGAKRTGYRGLSEQCGYDPKGENHKSDMQASAMTVLDLKRLVSFVPGTPDKPSFSAGELERRMELHGVSLPVSAARQALCHVEHAARHLIDQAVDVAIHRGVQTISPATMLQVLKPYRNSMEFSSIVAPVGLVRHAKSTPAQYRKVHDKEGKAKLLPSKETIIHPFEPNTAEKLRKDDVLAEYKEADKKMRAAEAKVAKKCLDHFNNRVAEVEAAKLAKRQKTASE